MNDFFTNLVGRHLGTCSTVQPRTPGRFEVDNSRDTISSLTTKPPEPVITKNVEFSDSQNIYSIPPIAEPDDATLQADLYNVQTSQSSTHDPSGKHDDIKPINVERHFDLVTSQQEQANRTTLAIDEHENIRNGCMQTHIGESYEGSRDKKNASALPADGRFVEARLNHRIRAMLERMPGNIVSPKTETDLNFSDNRKIKSLVSLSTGKKAISLESTSTQEQQLDRQDSISADDKENTTHYGRLEIPPWLPDLVSQFNPCMPKKPAKVEPVINVTIGRVEVRAVQTQAPINTLGPIKINRVMTLDEYLERREGRETK